MPPRARPPPATIDRRHHCVLGDGASPRTLAAPPVAARSLHKNTHLAKAQVLRVCFLDGRWWRSPLCRGHLVGPEFALPLFLLLLLLGDVPLALCKCVVRFDQLATVLMWVGKGDRLSQIILQCAGWIVSRRQALLPTKGRRARLPSGPVPIGRQSGHTFIRSGDCPCLGLESQTAFASGPTSGPYATFLSG